MQHPAAKSMIEISRTQDEEVGDGTTSVIILGNVMLIILNIIYCSYKSNSNIGNTLFIFINFAILNISTRSSLVRYFVCKNCLLTIKIHFVAAGGHSILPGIQSHIAFEIFYSS